MKTVCVALALAGSASAFIAPMTNVRATAPRSMSMSNTDQPQSRAEILSTVFAAGAAAVATAAVVPSAAFADGAKSLATQARARGVYGSRIEDLKPLVDKGDTEGVLAEKAVFTLFVSGVYSTDKAKFAKADDLAKKIVDAASTGDKSGMKSAYEEFMKFTEKKSGYKGAGDGQGLGSDFDYKNKTPLGTVYQR